MITVSRSSFLSVKSCSTCRWASPLNARIAIRSAGSICDLMNFIAAVSARIWSGTGMALMSKYIAISRRSRYRMSPGRSRRNLVRRHPGNRDRARGRRRRRCRWGGCIFGPSRQFHRRRRLVQLLEFAEADGLRHSVLGNREILGRQPLHRLPVLVLHRHRLNHQLRVGLELDDAVGGDCGVCTAVCCALARSTKISAREMAFMI